MPVRAPSPPPQSRPIQPPQPQSAAVHPRAVRLPQPPPPTTTTSAPRQDNSIAFRSELFKKSSFIHNKAIL